MAYRVPALESFEWQQAVEARATAPSGSESKGHRYLVIATATGAFTGKENYVAYYDGSSWHFDAPLEGMVILVKDEDSFYVYNGSNWILNNINVLPSTRLNDWSTTKLVNYLKNIHYKNQNIEFKVGAYAHGVNAGGNAYSGGVYSPTQNRIYLIPYSRADASTWHYIDCSNGSVNAYAHGVSAVDAAYLGGVYSPTQNRIYLVPYAQATQTNWHYIDCSDGSVHAYTHGVTAVTDAYAGGVYSPTQNRIYFVPQNQGYYSNTWHYIDCSDGTVHGFTAPSLYSRAYKGGVYSPTQNRIYFVPRNQGSSNIWHYIDCSDGSVCTYSNGSGVNAGGNAYSGGVYSPTQNRIYFVPANRADEAYWHYIDCSDGSVHAYAHGVTAVDYAYGGGVYSPTQNRIYLVPRKQANQSNWHYIDCSDGSVHAYTHGVTAVDSAYWCGVYSPTQNRIYFVPYAQANQSNWHYIQEFSTAEISPSIAASTLFNKY